MILISTEAVQKKVNDGKLSAIKGLRNCTGLGLKDAKHVVDTLQDGKNVDLSAAPFCLNEYEPMKIGLVTAGFYIENELRNLCYTALKIAVEEKRLDAAKALISIIEGI
jgi:hypothetical protein